MKNSEFRKRIKEYLTNPGESVYELAPGLAAVFSSDEVDKDGNNIYTLTFLCDARFVLKEEFSQDNTITITRDDDGPPQPGYSGLDEIEISFETKDPHHPDTLQAVRQLALETFDRIVWYTKAWSPETTLIDKKPLLPPAEEP
ncbi:MAG TPA: hypothetical protein VEA18_00375 [Candidatus Kapabacteria bacterium]|nr:hypothetical protein [Candidatus Kapabacteria bacterium]